MKRTLLAVGCLAVLAVATSHAATINISSPTVTETDSGTTTVTFDITCDPCTVVNAIVNWSTSDGTATAGTDYVAASGQIDDLGNGTAVETYPIEITVNGDVDFEGDESFFLDIDSASVGCPSLGGPGGCPTPPTAAQGTATIQNDDASNTPPAISADNAAVSANEGSAATNTGTFSDADGDTVALSASIGTVADTGSGTWSWSYNTTDGPDESATVTITADDGTATSQATFALTVNNVAPNNAADNASVTVDEGDPAANTGTFSDDGDDTVTLSASIGTVTDTGSGTWSWSFATTDGPDESATVIITATDSDNAATDASFSLIVVNTAPDNAADNASVTVDEGDPAANTGTFSDDGDDTVTLSASIGTVTDTGSGTWSWSFATTDGPDESATVIITATDSDGAATDASFSLIVVNTAPDNAADNASVTVDEGDPAANTGTFSDDGDDTVTLSASIGTVTDTGSGTWSWSFATTDGPDESATVIITATDSDGAATDASFSLIVVNTAPDNAADNASVTVDEGDPAANTGTFSDDGDDTVTLSASIGTVTDTGSGTWSWSFATTDGPDESATVIITATDSDGAATDASFSLIVVNTAPDNAADNASVTVDEGDPAANTGTFSDDGDDTVTLSASIGTVTDTGSGTWSWSFATTDGPDESATVIITATDSDGAATDASFALTVNNVAPTATANSYTTLEDNPVGGNVITDDTGAGVDSDPGADTLTVVAFDATSVGGGAVTVAGTGEFTYTPATDFCGPDSFGYTIDDDEDATDSATVAVDVTCVNDEPSFSAAGDQDVDEDSGPQTVAGFVTASAGPAGGGLGDETAQALTFNVTGNTNPALFAAAPAVGGSAGNLGELTYTPAANAFGSAQITLEVMDDGGTADGGDDTSPAQTFTITVDNVNDSPSFISGGNVITETGTGEQTVPWATAVSTGPANENQTATFTVTSDCIPTLLVAGPSIDPDGTLRFTPLDFAVGTCNVSATLSDGEDSVGPVPFMLQLVTASKPIADPQTVETDAGNPLAITLTGSDPDNQLPLAFQVIEPVTDADSGVIISDSGPFRGTLDKTTPPNETDTSAIVTYTPNAPTISQAAIIATDSFVLEKFADILGGDVVVNGAGGTATMERSTTTPAGFAIKAYSLNVHSTATVGGDALCNSGDYVGSCDPLTLPVYDLLPPFLVGSVDDDNDVNVPNKGTRNLTPGLYGDITVGREGDLVFAPGKYSMRSLSTDPKADLLFSGATEVKIADRLVLGSSVEVNASGAAGDVIFYVAGGDGANPAATVGFNNAVFNANVYAPNGTLSIGQDSSVTGAFIGRHVVVGGKATVQLANGFGEAPDEFAFEVTDDIGLRSERAVVEINPDDSCRDDAGQIVAIAAYAGTTSTDGAASIDITLRGCESTDVPVTVTATNGTQGTVSGLPAGPAGPPYEFVVTYTPSDPVPNNRDSFEFTFDNGISTATATVEINQPPCEFVEANSEHSFATDEGNPLTITLSGCDPDDGVLAISTGPIVVPPLQTCASCALSTPPSQIPDNRPGHTSANVVFTHSEVAAITVSFDYTVTGASDADTKTITVEVNPVPVAPEANDDDFSVTFGGSFSGNVLTNDTDANNDALTATQVGGAPAKASLFTLNPNGSFVYTHNGATGGTDSFQYQASDGALSSLPATANITIVAATISLSVTKAGPTGSEDSLITSTPAGINCPAGCTSDSAIFTTTGAIRLNVQPATGFVFTGWTGDAECAGGQLLPIADRNCVANFAVDTSTPPTGDPVLVTIQKAGDGGGTVTSNPAGIDCGAICSATISGEPRITLVAAADSGSVFNGFTGGSGNDCNDSELEAEFPTTCTATFTLAGRTLTILFSGNGGTVTSSPGGIGCSGEPCSASFANGTTVSLSARPDAGLPNSVSWGGAACQQDGTFNNKATVVMTADATCTVNFN